MGTYHVQYLTLKLQNKQNSDPLHLKSIHLQQDSVIHQNDFQIANGTLTLQRLACFGLADNDRWVITEYSLEWTQWDVVWRHVGKCYKSKFQVCILKQSGWGWWVGKWLILYHTNWKKKTFQCKISSVAETLNVSVLSIPSDLWMRKLNR